MSSEPSADLTPHRIACHLAEILADRGMTLTELSERTGITLANLSILKTGKARAVRFTTLTQICDALDTTPAELFSVRPEQANDTGTSHRSPWGAGRERDREAGSQAGALALCREAAVVGLDDRAGDRQSES